VLSFIRHPKDLWTGAIFLVVGLGAVIIGRDYPMGSATKMGPAYFPTILGAALAVLGLVAVIRSFGQTGGRNGVFACKEAVVVLAATVLFGVLVRGAGLAVAIIVLVMLSAYGSARFRWGPSIALAIGLGAFGVLVFVKALGLPIPALGAWVGG
jgi:hypothetical protein